MKRLLVGLTVILSLLVGCNAQLPVASPSVPEKEITPIPKETTIPRIDLSKDKKAVMYEEALVGDDTIGIGNVKIWVGSNKGIVTGGGYYPGATAEATLPIFNGYNEDKQVMLIVEPSAKLTRAILSDGSEDWGYQPAPIEVKNWVTLEEESPIIPAKSVREILITLKMPKEAVVFAQKWEFRITVVAMGQGAYETAVSQRWLVSMR